MARLLPTLVGGKFARSMVLPACLEVLLFFIQAFLRVADVPTKTHKPMLSNEGVCLREKYMMPWGLLVDSDQAP